MFLRQRLWTWSRSVHDLRKSDLNLFFFHILRRRNHITFYFQILSWRYFIPHNLIPRWRYCLSLNLKPRTQSTCRTFIFLVDWVLIWKWYRLVVVFGWDHLLIGGLILHSTNRTLFQIYLLIWKCYWLVVVFGRDHSLWLLLRWYQFFTYRYFFQILGRSTICLKSHLFRILIRWSC